MRKIFGPRVIDSTKDMWGLDEEDELQGVYRPTGHPGVNTYSPSCTIDVFPVLNEHLTVVVRGW